MEKEEQYIHSLDYSDISRALSRDFFRVYCVNTDTDVYVEFIPHENDKSLDVRTLGKDFKEVVNRMKENTYSEDLDTVRTAVTKQNILNVLSVDSNFLLDYRTMVDGVPTYVKLKAARIRQEDPSHILFALSDTDAHMQRLAKYDREAEQNLTYAAVSEALAVDYICIYYVDLNTGKFREYNSNSLYKTMNFPTEGDDFFEAAREDFLNLIYEEDRDTFLNGFDQENLKKVLSEDRKFLMTYRVLIQGNPVFIRMKATKMLNEDDHHIVIGLSNIDASVKRTEQYRQMREIANRDSMTGVKSKHCFTTDESLLDREIAEGRKKAFAVAVCDVNGLKQINDTLGHKAGDQYIKDACALICEVFKHSPVYRIGGDEFVVLLKGYDYDHFSELLDKLNRKVEENQNTGGVVVSVGISEFVPGEDCSVESVFERADARMYERKAELKSRKK